MAYYGDPRTDAAKAEWGEWEWREIACSECDFTWFVDCLDGAQITVKHRILGHDIIALQKIYLGPVA